MATGIKTYFNWFMYDFQLHNNSELKYKVRLLTTKVTWLLRCILKQFDNHKKLLWKYFSGHEKYRKQYIFTALPYFNWIPTDITKNANF